MQTRSQKIVHTIVLVYENGQTRTVKVKAVSRETAEAKALKFNPSAMGVKRA